MASALLGCSFSSGELCTPRGRSPSQSTCSLRHLQGAGFLSPCPHREDQCRAGCWLPSLPPLLGLQGTAQPPRSEPSQHGHLLLRGQLSSLLVLQQTQVRPGAQSAFISGTQLTTALSILCADKCHGDLHLLTPSPSCTPCPQTSQRCHLGATTMSCQAPQHTMGQFRPRAPQPCCEQRVWSASQWGVCMECIPVCMEERELLPSWRED